jgi:hypothetical protein
MFLATHIKRCHHSNNLTDDACNAYYALLANFLQHIKPCIAADALLQGVCVVVCRKNMNCLFHGVHDLPIRRCPGRPRGALPLAVRPLVKRSHDGHAYRGASCVPYGQGPCGTGFGSYFPNGP